MECPLCHRTMNPAREGVMFLVGEEPRHRGECPTGSVDGKEPTLAVNEVPSCQPGSSPGAPTDELCECGDSLEDHSTSKGACVFCSCKVYAP